jgi:hypothetical protein
MALGKHAPVGTTRANKDMVPARMALADYSLGEARIALEHPCLRTSGRMCSLNERELRVLLHAVEEDFRAVG